MITPCLVYPQITLLGGLPFVNIGLKFEGTEPGCFRYSMRWNGRKGGPGEVEDEGLHLQLLHAVLLLLPAGARLQLMHEALPVPLQRSVRDGLLGVRREMQVLRQIQHLRHRRLPRKTDIDDVPQSQPQP
jgi:hypothetical protein